MGEIWVIYCDDVFAKGKTTLLKYIFKYSGSKAWNSSLDISRLRI